MTVSCFWYYIHVLGAYGQHRDLWLLGLTFWRLSHSWAETLNLLSSPRDPKSNQPRAKYWITAFLWVCFYWFNDLLFFAWSKYSFNFISKAVFQKCTMQLLQNGSWGKSTWGYKTRLKRASVNTNLNQGQ